MQHVQGKSKSCFHYCKLQANVTITVYELVTLGLINEMNGVLGHLCAHVG